ncbi:MAG: hypothetical protein KY475_08910 [Planctomycetes bacterium]|nr:hypothetical protein [Planctomycetota bacterium]
MQKCRRSRATGALALVVVWLAMTAPSRATDLSGSWSGTWKSCTSGHEGPLRAEFVRRSACCYDVTFRGRFFKILPFRYSVAMRVIKQDGCVYLSGSKDLGRLFGVFSFAAAADGCRFHADYSSCEDKGCFRLSRETCGACCGRAAGWTSPAR